MPFRLLARILPVVIATAPLVAEAEPPSGVPTINALGLDLYRQQIKSAGNGNVVLSPYSIATVLAMTYAGADGDTKAEMHKVLHLPADQATSNAAFHALADELAETVRLTEEKAVAIRKNGGEFTALQLDVANRLFIQSDYVLRRDFLGDL